jgi:hypothetical protein
MVEQNVASTASIVVVLAPQSMHCNHGAGLREEPTLAWDRLEGVTEGTHPPVTDEATRVRNCVPKNAAKQDGGKKSHEIFGPTSLPPKWSCGGHLFSFARRCLGSLFGTV